MHIEFTEEQDLIRLEGPPEDVEQATNMLQQLVSDLVCSSNSCSGSSSTSSNRISICSISISSSYRCCNMTYTVYIHLYLKTKLRSQYEHQFVWAFDYHREQ